MSEPFSVGEIAIIVSAPNCDDVWPEFIGEEVQVVEGLRPQWIWENRARTYRRLEEVYVVRTAWGEEIAVLPEGLRKKRPPMDPAYIQWRDALVKEFAMGEPSHV